MITYRISSTELNFVSMKATLDAKLAQEKQNKEDCAYGIVEKKSPGSIVLSYDHVYTFMKE